MQDIPFVMVRADDVLVSGASDDEHRHHLEEVFRTLQKTNLKLKLVKCLFMVPVSGILRAAE